MADVESAGKALECSVSAEPWRLPVLPVLNRFHAVHSDERMEMEGTGWELSCDGCGGEPGE